MNKAEFISQLRMRLNKLPETEVKNAITYYEEYFDEAGKENEGRVIKELESPANVASKIIADFAIKDVENSEDSAKKGLSIIWTVLLAILASPIALPLALAVVILALAIILVIFFLLISFGIMGSAFVLSGFISFIIGIIVLFEHFATGILFIGIALLMIGVGIVFLKLTIFLSKKSFGWLANKMSKFLLRRSRK